MTTTPQEKHLFALDVLRNQALDFQEVDGLSGQDLFEALRQFARDERFVEYTDEDIAQIAEYAPPQEQPPLEQSEIFNAALKARDKKALLTDANINYLAAMKRLSPLNYGIVEDEIKQAFGKAINLVLFKSAIAHAVRKQQIDETGEQLDVADVARTWANSYRDTWAYDSGGDIWRVWNGSYWESQPKTHLLDRYAVSALQEAGITVSTQGSLNLFERLVEADCLRDFTSQPGLINFANGTLDLTLMRTRGYSKDDNLTYCLPFSYDPFGSHSVINRFLTEVLPDEYARLDYMAHGGLALMRDTLIHQFCGYIGPTRGGKSLLLALLNALGGAIDRDIAFTFAGPSIFSRELEGKRARFKWSNSLLVAVDELPAEAFSDEENLKIMTAHGGIEMRGIGKDEQIKNRWKPKLIFTTNDQPSYKDNSGAIKERAVFTEIAHTIPKDRRDPQLFEKLLPELGAFAASCIELALQAIERGYYPQSKQMKILLDRIANESNPLKHFVHDQCVLGSADTFKVPTDTLYERYILFCEENGHKGKFAKTNFAKELRMMNIGIEPKMIWHNSTNVRGLIGIRLREEHDSIHEDDFYQDDVPFTKPTRILTDLNGVKNPPLMNGMASQASSEAVLTVLTGKESNSTRSNGIYTSHEADIHISPPIEDRALKKPLRLLRDGVEPPVEQDEHLNGHKTPPLRPLRENEEEWEEFEI